MPQPTTIDVFEYLDYRAYLRDYYAERKLNASFSYRAFSHRAKLGSPNYLKLVIDGERNLTGKMAERFAAACRLEGEPAAYFCALVALGQARTVGERNEAYARLKRFRRYRDIHRLELAQDAYHSRWYLPAIRELVLRSDFSEDPEWIAERLIPKIKPAEAETALEILQQLGMLERSDDGKLGQGTALVTTGAETHSLHLANFHRSMMQHAAESLDRVPAEQRDISSLTVCLSPDGLARFKQAVQRFRRELLEASDLENDPTQVVQINFQLFPLSSTEAP